MKHISIILDYLLEHAVLGELTASNSLIKISKIVNKKRISWDAVTFGQFALYASNIQLFVVVTEVHCKLQNPIRLQRSEERQGIPSLFHIRTW